MKRTVKKLLVKKTNMNSLAILKRNNILVIGDLFLKEIKHQIKNKTDLGFFSHDLLIKRKN